MNMWASPMNKKKVLDGVSFTAKEGEVTALVGPSGSGKSTCARLAARLWEISEGTIQVGGVDISTVDPEVLLTDYSMVFQDVVLFDDTVMENIRLGRRGATDEEVRAAAEAANCDEFVRRLPKGLRYAHWGKWLQAVRRGTAAHLHRPGAFEERAHRPAGRGHRFPGCGERNKGPGGPLPPAPEQDRAGHRLPDAHRGGRRSHRRVGKRPRGRGGHAGGADGAGRSLPPHGGTSERERTVAVECRQMIGRQKAGDLRESPAFCPV